MQIQNKTPKELIQLHISLIPTKQNANITNETSYYINTQTQDLLNERGCEGYLFDDLLDQPAPLARRCVLSTKFVVGHQVEVVVESQELGNGPQEVDAESLKSVVASEVSVAFQHDVGGGLLEVLEEDVGRWWNFNRLVVGKLGEYIGSKSAVILKAQQKRMRVLREFFMRLIAVILGIVWKNWCVLSQNQQTVLKGFC